MTHQPDSPDTNCDGRIGEWSQFPDSADRVRAADVTAPSPGPFVAGLACGLLMGSLVALLLTPRKGRDTRHWLADRGRSVGRWTSNVLHREELMGIVRRSGVVGLAEWRRRNVNRAVPQTGA